jgi:hypothetical protein
MNFYLEAEIYKTGKEPCTIRATVNAPTLHWAKRLIVQDILSRRYWVKNVQVISPEEHQMPPWGEAGEL